jgi:hypothetical protein
MPSTEDITSFIKGTFLSAWALELLGFLMRNPETRYSHEEMVAALRGSDLVVTQSVNALGAAGLLLREDDGSARYAPASPDLAALAEGAIALYATSPDAVRRMIVSAANPSLSAFADAFRLRKD